MKPAPPCDPVPPELKARAAEAEHRKNSKITELQAIADRHLDELVGQEPDAFVTAMRALIDADRAAVRLIDERRKHETQ